MTTVAVRTDEIWEVERFRIRLYRDGLTVDNSENGVLGAYEFSNKMSDAKTVADWREGRFKSAYPRFTCDVLLADGTIAHGSKKLKTVRDTYPK